MRSLVPVVGFQRGDKLRELVIGDEAQLPNLDAAKLLGAEKVVHLVPADVEQFGYLLDGVCLQPTSPPRVLTLRRCLSVCLRARIQAFTCRHARDVR